MRETKIERRLIREVKKLGGLCLKWISGISGVPDRIVILPEGVFFVETKAPGKKPDPLQIAVHKMLRKAGGWVEIIDTYEKINAFVNEIHSTRLPATRV